MTSSDFVQLLRESVITQAVVTVLMLLTVVGLLIAGRVVPSELWALNGLTIGFYFGGKVQAQAMRLARAEAVAEGFREDGERRAPSGRGPKV